MANSNSPWGLRPVQNMLGSPYNGQIMQYATATGDATAMFVGDPVKFTGTSQFINGLTYANVTQAATGDVICGVVTGFLQTDRDSPLYRVASTQRLALVDIDPNSLFEIQQVAGGTPLTANDINLNANFVVAAGSTFTGQSGVTIDNTTEAVANTLDLKIVGVPLRPDNDPGTAVGTGADSSRFYVRINRHFFVNQIAGV